MQLLHSLLGGKIAWKYNFIQTSFSMDFVDQLINFLRWWSVGAAVENYLFVAGGRTVDDLPHANATYSTAKFTHEK